MKPAEEKTFEQDGVVYSRSNTAAHRFACRLIGVVLVVIGALLSLVFRSFGIAMALGGVVVFFVVAKVQTAEIVSIKRPSLAGCPTFGEWNVKVHRGAAQSDRFERATHECIGLKKYNPKTGVATISGSTGNTYTTTLDYCSCEDFQKRSKPCKHIYFLATQMGFTDDDFYN